MTRMGEGRVVHRVLMEKPEGKSHWEDPDVDGRIILRWIFEQWEGWILDGVGSGYRQMAGTCEYVDELSGSIKCGEFLH